MKLKKINTSPARNKEKDRLINETLQTYANDDMEALFRKLSTGPGGLSQEEARLRLAQYGANLLATGKKHTILRRLREAIINPFNIILLLIAGITFFTDVLATSKPDYLTVMIILSLVVLSSIVAFVQSRASDTAIEKLSKMVVNRTGVLRDGKLVEIPIDEVVPGDILRLSAGDMLPADVRFIATKDLFVAQSALTGESGPVEKFTSAMAASDTAASALTDLACIGFMGSNVISGSAAAVVLTTGSRTYFGAMAKSLTGDRAKTSFENGVGSVSRLLIRMMLVMVPIVFLINGLVKGDWSGALLFSISIAVGLTPEMLPVIMTSTLARGAVTMSKHKVIVRTLGAIQTFGEMDILCTDKTGTLTEDKIVLEKYMNLHGEDDDRVLRHAYLNSRFQTGLKNLIDLAVITRAVDRGLEPRAQAYHLIDEIPFDFTRRRMSVVLEDGGGKRQLITKGAVEEILSVCTHAEQGGEVIVMTDSIRGEAMATYERFNTDGLRMIAVAQKNNVGTSDGFSVTDECDMVLIGFIGFLDPPKESAKQAITALRMQGVRTVVLTGDSEGVAVKVCQKVGVGTQRVVSGAEIDAMDDAALMDAAAGCDLFAKLSPSQKERVIGAFRTLGHTVGYMGDGINDAPALRQADIGISVDSAVDIAKESADMILLKKDLMVLEEGVIEGRRTFANIMKYIKMAASGNFGNMISVLVASIFLPFLPMLPVQLLAQNLLCDIAQLGMPFDHVDADYLEKPHRWDTRSIRAFMVCYGPLSSLFDLACFAVMWFVLGANTVELAPLFRCGWFVFGTISQSLSIQIIRTAKMSLRKNKPSGLLFLSTVTVAVAACAIGFTDFAVGLDMARLPLHFFPWLVLLITVYLIAAQMVKRLYINRRGEWI